MSNTLEKRLDLISETDHISQLTQINRGIEKEGLRTNLDGQLAQTPHPSGLGSALTHPSITTDYSEALLELITPVFDSTEKALGDLSSVHSFCHTQLDEELIWAASMPCFLGGDDAIPIAQYGNSNVGRLKYVYRVGLAHRYGKMMQTIAGIHYNFSLPESFWPNYQQSLGETGGLKEFQTEQYFGMIRNFRRHGWLILYLFGASPALCPSFLQGREHQLESLASKTLYAPYGTSLRMGDLGYQNNAQQHLNVCYNKLEDYVSTLGAAIHSPHQDYKNIGVKVDGEYRQLNTNVLQIENEYYSGIRPKRVTPSGKKPLYELAENGVQYIELRNVDINPFLPTGIDAEQSRFLDCFLLHCLLEESPFASDKECSSMDYNKNLVVNRGREPNLELRTCTGQPLKLRDWGMDVMAKLGQIADVMDRANGVDHYSAAVKSQIEKLEQPEATPSARIIQTLKDKNISFFEFALNQSKAHRDFFKGHPPAPEQMQQFKKLAEDSFAQQRAIEENDSIGFDEFLQNYMAD